MSEAQVARQIALEEEAVSIGQSRYRKDRPMPWSDSAGKFDEAALPPGAALLRKYTSIVALRVEAGVLRFREGKAGKYARTILQYLDGVDPTAVAYIALRCALNASTREQTFVSCAVAIGAMIEEHIAYEEWRQDEDQAGLARWWAEKAKESSNLAHRKNIMRGAFQGNVRELDWSREAKLKVGTWMLEILELELGLVERFTERDNRKTRYVLRPTSSLREWLDEMHSKCELLAPLSLPMVAPPVPWTSPVSGGYYTRPMHRSFVIKAKKAHIDDLFSTDLDRVYGAVNALQETRWSIHVPILNVIREFKESTGGVPSIPSAEDAPLPLRPSEVPEDVPLSSLSEEHKARLKAWKGEAKRVHTENAKRMGKRYAFAQQLWVAEKFAEEEAIYFPYQIDSRGRIYTIPTLVSPQSDHLGKAMLRFADGRPLGENGAYWLAVHVANVWAEDNGHGTKTDKLPFDERVQWVLDNEEMILECGLSAPESLHLWGEADKPWQFLAACMEWAGYVMSGRSEDYESRLPIAMDGSCSGLQHYSAVLRDPVGGRAVNLTNTGQVEDIYSEVAGRVAAKVIGTPWEGRIHRKTVKQPCMTYAYSATTNGMRDQIIAAVNKMGPEGQPEGWEDSRTAWEQAANLAVIVRECIEEVVVAAAGAMSWMQDVSKIATDLGRPLRWRSASGLPVIQAETRPKRQRNSIWYGGERLRLDTHEEGTVLDKRAQASAVAPNWVHSQDAAHLVATVNALSAEGVSHFAMIHDSFGVHACDVDLMHVCLRETFVEQYETNRLEELRRQLESYLGTELPPTPPVGDLDLRAVLDAEYTFA